MLDDSAKLLMPRRRRKLGIWIVGIALFFVLASPFIFPMIGMEIACRAYDQPTPDRPGYKFLSGLELRKLTNGDLFIELNNMGGVTSYEGGDRSGWKAVGVSGPAVPAGGLSFIGNNIICSSMSGLRPFSGWPRFGIERIARDRAGKLFSFQTIGGEEFSFPLRIITVEAYRNRRKYSDQPPSPRT